LNATGRGRRDGSLIPLVPPGGTPLAGSLLVVSKQSRATRLPPAGNWVRFSCSIPRLFVLSHNMPMINTTGKLGSFWRFSITAGSLRSDSLATILSLHASRSMPHAPPAGTGRARTLPAGCCLPPTVKLSKTERDPISTSGPSILSMSPNQAIPTEKSIRFPHSPLPDR
jgi:hypothetical protein